MSKALLEISGLVAGYGHLPVLHGIDLSVKEGEIAAIIGANGAGKTTLMMSIFGNPKPSAGRILFEGRDITDLPAHAVALERIAQSPEGRRIFPRMTVLENLQMGTLIAPDKERYEDDLGHVFELFPVLATRKDQRAGTLSGGEQQMLAIARALMGQPRLLLLDEPSLGLAPLITRQIFAAIKALNEEGLTVLLVEQNAYHALKLASCGYVMVNGRITLSGSGTELLESDEVRRSYLEGGASSPSADEAKKGAKA
ncbi:High-affinity branched-chain amino acid transport ATP-binding protein LivF [Methyloligella halotolerans]|uniref:High-affinity branched-chain amino acid transport ATP-binding protein LivF n=1 Tax=Methyloligella halotolerans TaxID=1177755 RepID=A0A1E2S2Y4_9HYPH|nr:ABC transporter ATP-binding protein [Methyloligella halotolerans]ODA68867.1 High-affinity branched-chain amino acid transport ATP-binding protein LivF [Methyloligella halotolerans]